jgi:hypothetical protein
MSKSKRLILTFGLLAAWLLLAGRLAAALNGLDLSWHVTAGSGGRSSSAGYTMDGSIGQPIVASSGGAGYQLSAGFWTFLGAQPTMPTPTGSPQPTVPTPTGSPPPTTPTPTGSPPATTPTPTRSPPPTTPTPTPTPTGIPCPNVLPHGDFEAGVQSPWGMVGGAQMTTARAHGGTHSVRLGGAHNHNSEVFAALELPPEATAITLSYWWYVESSDPNPGADHLAVILGAPGDETTLETITNVSPRDAWQHSAHDLTDHAGEGIGLTFHASTDGAGLTSFYVDDVEVLACGAPPGAHRIYLPVLLKANGRDGWIRGQGATVERYGIGAAATRASRPVQVFPVRPLPKPPPPGDKVDRRHLIHVLPVWPAPFAQVEAILGADEVGDGG